MNWQDNITLLQIAFLPAITNMNSETVQGLYVHRLISKRLTTGLQLHTTVQVSKDVVYILETVVSHNEIFLGLFF